MRFWVTIVVILGGLFGIACNGDAPIGGPVPADTVKPQPQADPNGPHGPAGTLLLRFTQKNVNADFTWQHGMIAQDWHPLSSGITDVWVPDDGQYVAGSIRMNKQLPLTEHPKAWYISCFIYDDGGQIIAYVQDGAAIPGKIYTCEAHKGG